MTHPALAIDLFATSANSPAPLVAPQQAERLPSSDAADGAGETRFVLDEPMFVAALEDDLPAFLTAPRAEYLGMIERGAE